MAVEGTERLITNFMIHQSKFPKILGIVVGDHGHPATFQRTASPGIQVTGTPRLNNKRSDQSQRRRITTRMILDHVTAFLLINRNVPLIFLRLFGRHNGARSGRRVGLAARTDDHGGTIYLKTSVLIFQLVAEFYADTFSLVSSNNQGLNSIALKSIGNRTGVQFLFTGRRILFFFRPNFVNVLVQNIHIARVVITPLIEGNFYVDGGNIKLFYGNVAGTVGAFIYLGGCFGGPEEIALSQLMSGPGVVKTTPG